MAHDQIETGNAALESGDERELWLPPGTIEGTRGLWCQRRLDSPEVLPQLLEFITPRGTCSQRGQWLRVRLRSRNLVVTKICRNSVPLSVYEVTDPLLSHFPDCHLHRDAGGSFARPNSRSKKQTC